jgi:predicted nucleic acid-binding protein
MIVLDTNVVSELMRPSPAARVIEWVSQQAAPTMYFTTISEAELRYGVAILPAGRRRDGLLAGVEGMLREDFAGRIIPFDREAALAYAEIASARRASGHPINHADCQIAAIAHSIGAAVATRDEEDFEGCGINVINPWANPALPG